MFKLLLISRIMRIFECNSLHEISIETIDNYLDLEGKERTILH